jgi:MFS family permease
MTDAGATIDSLPHGRPASYLSEFRHNIRPLAAASLGAGASLPFFAYTNSIFAPHLMEDFGWPRAQFALVGLTMLACLPILPVVGRLTDLFGVKRVALTGTLLLVPCFIAYSLMQGSFVMFLAIFTAVLAVGSATSTLTFARLVVESFDRARGLALTVMNCTPSALAIAGVPLLNWSIERFGWRASFLGLGVYAFVVGMTAVLLIPPRLAKEPIEKANAAMRPRAAREDYGTIFRSPIFWLIMAGMFLCLLQTPLHSGQMNIMLLDNGLTSQTASNIVSVYALGTIIGRVGCGLALDRFSTPLVTAISMGLPALGYVLLGTSLDAISIITFSMFLVGLSVGAESDLVGYLVARYFKMRIFNTVSGLLFTVSFLVSATGALLISLTLHLADSFAPFLFLVAGTITVGSVLFLLLPKRRDFEKIG